MAMIPTTGQYLELISGHPLHPIQPDEELKSRRRDDELLVDWFAG